MVARDMMTFGVASIQARTVTHACFWIGGLLMLHEGYDRRTLNPLRNVVRRATSYETITPVHSNRR